jgi:DNA-binding NtrC family response regulator
MDEIKHLLKSMQGQAPLSINNTERPLGSEKIVADDEDYELKPTTLASMERDMIKQSLQKFAGSRRKSARALQISERTLYRKIKEYGL